MDVEQEEMENVVGTKKNEKFTILGAIPKKKFVKTTRVLPDWLANPTIIDMTLSSTFRVEDMQELDPLLAKILREQDGITHFFPVQREVIPWLLRSDRLRIVGPQSDLCVSAPTGSGKTLAYVLPVVQGLKNRLLPAIRALVVLPVKDLAVQVYKVFMRYCKGTSLKVGLAAADDVFSKEQSSLIRTGPSGTRSLVDILVATPGRLLDHLRNTPGFSLSQLRYLVLDEADRTMMEEQQPWLEALDKKNLPSLTAQLAAEPAARPFRKLLYSATLSQDPERLQVASLFHPKLFAASTGWNSSAEDSYATPQELREFFAVCASGTKPLVAWYLLQHRGFRRVLCFANSVSNAHRLCCVLREMGGDLVVEPFSSRHPQKKRNTLLSKFSVGEVNVLVTSDVLTRGMDVEDVDCTLLYDCPPLFETYIHRVGRTARAGKEGTAITLLEENERQKFKAMISREVKVETLNVTQDNLQPFQEIYKRALARTSKLMEQERGNVQKQKNPFLYQRKKPRVNRSTTP